ncbi:enoyl-CoA hydratase/isomerase family protein [Bacillus marasmi]|uniref:enoyl-CoA hydratase/isomerase family protein n=1 Tax=Bacillus marasmi TaxID=1926279 RepID=UPI0011CCA694|nr:enoyl-CoA hydratase/isomerase family protein [Bacillus marasmi]
MGYQFIRADIDNNIAIISINRPPLNTLNRQIYHELLSMIDELEACNEVSGIVITGGGEKAFVAGRDLIQMQHLKPFSIHELTTIARAALTRIERVSKPVVAAVNGLALDSGLELALACDYCICTNQATFAFPVMDETKQQGSRTKRMERVLSQERVKELVTHRVVFGAEIALELHIVDEIVSTTELLSVSKDWAGKLALKGVI